MNNQQVLSVARDLLQVIGTFLTTYGVLNSGQWEAVAGGILMIVPVVWGIYSHTQANAVATVAAMPMTDVTSGGRTITILDSGLATAAKNAATPSNH
jgi:hypothetical protein